MCTTIIVTPGATVDGTMYVTHTDDNMLADQRLVFVPAADHKPGSRRPVYPALLEYPRLVCKERGPGYDIPRFKRTKPVGDIPQVDHTYAYYDGSFGIMNEHQLCIGECSNCAQKYEGPKGDSKHLFYTPELSRVALERCTKAREAVELMGKLIDQYGYYDCGETLLVGDPKEAWVFEICAVPKGKGLWVAKKVPDGHIFAAANNFRIREAEPDKPDEMLYSPNLFSEVKRLGWESRDKEGRLDWAKTVSYGEYRHPYYSLRRVWSIFRRANPSLHLPAWVKEGFAYPFSIKPGKKLKLEDVIELHRDHYEDTPFDLTKGLAAGPFGNPNRYFNLKTETNPKGYDNSSGNLTTATPHLWGAYERPISLYFCGFVTICGARESLPDELGVIWFGYDQPSTSCFVPFYAGAPDVPRAYQKGTMNYFDRNFAFWVFNSVANLACLKYCYMVEDIKAKQQELESESIKMQKEIEEETKRLLRETDGKSKAQKYLFDKSSAIVEKVLKEWWDLLYFLFHKYSNGYINTFGETRKKDGNKVLKSKEVGYPLWWRKAVGYAQGPTSYLKHK